MGILSENPLGLSLFCLVILLGAAHGFDPTNIAQQPSAFPPASAPESIAQPPSSTVIPPASAQAPDTALPPSIAQAPDTALPPSIAQAPDTALPPSIAQAPDTALPPSIAQPPSSIVFPPASAPFKQPPSNLPPRKLVAVQGAVFCKACGRPVNLLGAAPLEGAVVKLQCKNTKFPIEVETKTDKNGQFFIKAPNTVTTYGYHKCRVLLGDSPNGKCNSISGINYNGAEGAMLKRSSKPPESANLPAYFQLFTAGPFVFFDRHPC